MTSKETLKLARTEFEKDFEDGEETNQWLKDVIKGLDKAEKDLEVLQVLKDKLPHITILRVMECEDTYVLYNSINCTSITKEEYELLKEWLSNDKGDA